MGKKIIPYGKQDIDQVDIDAVIETLKSDYLTQGPKILEFEEAFAKYVGSKYAVAVSNGTAGLHLGAMALNVKEGQKVITTPITFAASGNGVRYCGAEVEFADIDPETYLIDIEQVKRLLENAPKGTYAGIVPVNFAGRVVNLEKLRAIADEYNLWIMEDACHAPGGYFVDSKGEKQSAGNGNYAELTVFSFHPVKHIACGEGGMVTTSDPQIYKSLMELRTHGIVKNEDLFTNSIETAQGANGNYPGWYMEMQNLGYNYRLTDIQATLGITQLAKADKGLDRRREIARVYSDSFSGENGLLGHSGVVEGHAYHLYIVEVEDRLGLYEFLREKGIYAQVHYVPMHLMPFYKKEGVSFEKSESYYSRCLSLPMYPTLDNEDQNFVINCVKEFLNG
ncbi:MAG: UDP-4-amino-4,6-dideoxy-N-acetyl-beta-L-altrosamine transaminase [Sphingobacteriales bacterium]|jgi:UDP-4-amino-4,6-dideoxy-N-acetyl-beta-L-altrosamine transaminase